jgi:hypothetical protein
MIWNCFDLVLPLWKCFDVMLCCDVMPIVNVVRVCNRIEE